MKIIFLDIDGVLNNSSCWGNRPDTNKFDQNCIYAFNKIIDKTNAKIVISSTWRLLYDFDELVYLLKSVGVKGDIIGQTLLIKLSTAMRGDEIWAWLFDNKRLKDSFIILDDNTDMRSVMAHLVQCNPCIGLTKELADIAIRKFDDQEYSRMKIKKCPFCGANGEILRIDSTKNSKIRYGAGCSIRTCWGYLCSDMCYSETKKEAINLWNKRV